MEPKVSVVVPIYKVERYLRRCVNSIIKQTYLNLEIILVNDGSPDNCQKIIEDYAKTDARICAVYKQNGGLADARNFGMKYVTGEYTLFVDSDDWLHPKVIMEMVSKSAQLKADVVQSNFYYAYDDYLLFDHRNGIKEEQPIVLDNRSLMRELVINDRIKNFAWGKLYKTSIIKNLPFDKGVLFEDVFWAHKVMHRVNTYVIINQPLYFYYQRNDSIVGTYTPRNLDILKGLKERHSFIEIYYKELINESYKMIVKTCLIHYNLLLRNGKKDKGRACRREIQVYIKTYYINLKKAVENDKDLSKQLDLFVIHPYLNVFYLLIQKTLRLMKIVPQPIGLKRVNY